MFVHWNAKHVFLWHMLIFPNLMVNKTLDSYRWIPTLDRCIFVTKAGYGKQKVDDKKYLLNWLALGNSSWNNWGRSEIGSSITFPFPQYIPGDSPVNFLVPHWKHLVIFFNCVLVIFVIQLCRTFSILNLMY